MIIIGVSIPVIYFFGYGTLMAYGFEQNDPHLYSAGMLAGILLSIFIVIRFIITLAKLIDFA
jgi:hypothetical protein